MIYEQHLTRRVLFLLQSRVRTQKRARAFARRHSHLQTLKSKIVSFLILKNYLFFQKHLHAFKAQRSQDIQHKALVALYNHAYREKRIHKMAAIRQTRLKREYLWRLLVLRD
mmetsp:Transcript_25323/g.39136  ORF Transcript_25323/g.39136 Transcript_25323/m.39136 type:complete len:112 (+) Transcript_25323:1419-1754(+)